MELAETETRLQMAAKMASHWQRQSQELKAWLIALLKRTGPQTMPLSAWEAVQKGETFLVTPTEVDPSIVELRAAEVDELAVKTEGPQSGEPSA
jgi:hypothetical protein